MRIIGGSARSRRFLAPKGSGTRPTQDRVRESLFNIIASKCLEARVLDLFAGSGALGFEALSRGAAEATLVDIDKKVVALLQQNMKLLKLDAPAYVLKSGWGEALKQLAAEHKQFDLIFIDPPYQMENQQHILKQITAKGLLAPGGWIVYEHDENHEADFVPPGLDHFDKRKYRDTFISFYKLYGEATHE